MSNPTRIEVDSREPSATANILKDRLASFGITTVRLSKVYTLSDTYTPAELEAIANALHNPVVEDVRINRPRAIAFDWALELGFLPGVTDNVATTTTEIIEDLLKRKVTRNSVFSSRLLFLTGNVKEEAVELIARELINTLIERFHIRSKESYDANGMELVLPVVKLTAAQDVLTIDLDLPEAELAELGKKGILDPAGKRRGPLALDLAYLNAIKAYFEKEGRQPTDIELESIAQTWSEHCKHTIFASPIDDIEEGIYKRFIKGATEKIRKQKGEKDFCVSVFKDNSGAIIFDDEYLITDKAETHNTPSALDPYGGAITGIVGVNRDTIGFGLGALPIANKYGFCVGQPEETTKLFRDKGLKTPVLSPKKILEGVINGVNVGGNCSGIPTPNGFVYFDDGYTGKPLIFVGTIGLIPRKLPDGRQSHEKQARPGDKIVMIGGRVGADGIHGATFSSEALNEGSPATAVQIGDPITQKKVSDAIVKEARDQGLYSSITDNGAGGLSCSVAEMAEESGGFTLALEKVPLKYPGLQPWEVWISESQERMTLAVPPEKLEAFEELMTARGVETTVLGEFTASRRAIVTLNGEEIFNLEMAFLHHGLPKRQLTTKPYPYTTAESKQPERREVKNLLLELLGSHNCCSFEWISRQYDHEVQSSSVIKPLQEPGRVNTPAAVIKPLHERRQGVVMSQALFPRLSELDASAMAACAIDTAIRYAVAAGADIEHLALMDNFCWCSSDEPERLAQLKDTAKAAYEVAVAYQTPFISGKDSMFNDFKGYNESGDPIKVSVKPTLLISSIGVLQDARQSCTIDLKEEGDLLYVLGETKDECGASEYYALLGIEGGTAPQVDARASRSHYKKVHEAIGQGLLSGCAAVAQGGLGITLAKMAIAGRKGATIDLSSLCELPLERKLFSESQGRFLISVNPEKREAFEELMKGVPVTLLGETGGDVVNLNDGDEKYTLTLKELEESYKERFSTWG